MLIEAKTYDGLHRLALFLRKALGIAVFLHWPCSSTFNVQPRKQRPQRQRPSPLLMVVRIAPVVGPHLQTTKPNTLPCSLLRISKVVKVFVKKLLDVKGSSITRQADAKFGLARMESRQVFGQEKTIENL